MAASIASPPVAMPALTPPGSAPIADSRSPWAPPPTQPMAPSVPSASAQPAPVAAPLAPSLPAVAAPVVAAPVVAAPTPPMVAAGQAAATAAAAAGRRRTEPEDNKGKFRETMWFKKGDLDAQAAIAAAEERARTGKDVAGDKADSKPIDERYNDDGSVTRADKEKYSLRTGSTMMMQSIPDSKKASASLSKVSEDELIGEMKGGRGKVIAAIVAGVIVLILIVILIAR
jgi:hypothetical protein